MDIFRTGRTVGRTIYIQALDHPSTRDTLIGVFDTRELAAFAVAAMNEAVDRGAPLPYAWMGGDAEPTADPVLHPRLPQEGPERPLRAV